MWNDRKKALTIAPRPFELFEVCDSVYTSKRYMASENLPLHLQNERGQVDATKSHETVQKAMIISGGAADARSERNFSEETGGDSELEHALAELKRCSEMLQSTDDVKAQTLNELVDQNMLLEEVKARLEKTSASKSSAVKGSIDTSQSHPEACRVTGQEHSTRQDKVEATKKEESTETSKSSPDLEKTTQHKYCTGEDEVLVTKQEHSTETPQIQPDSDKAAEQKHSTRQDGVEATKQEDSTEISETPLHSDKAQEQKHCTRQDEVEAINQEDSSEISQIQPDSDEAAEQKHSTRQDEAEATEQEDSTEISQNPLDSDKAQEQKHWTRQDEVEEIKQEDSTEISQIPLDSDEAQEQKHCTKQDEAEAIKKEDSTETSQSPPISDKAPEQKHYTSQDAVEATKNEDSTEISRSPSDSVKNIIVQGKNEVEATEKELTSVSEDLVLAKQEIAKLQVEIRLFGEKKIDKFDSIQAAEKTANLVLQKVLDLLKDRLEGKLVAAKAASMETSSEEALSASGQDTEHKSKVIPKEDLEGLIKDLATLQSSISKRKQTSFKLDECIDTRGGTGEAKDNQSVSSEETDLNLSELVADLQKASVAEAIAVRNAGSKVDELEEVKFRLKKAADENATFSATVDSLRIRWNITKAELESILDREKTAAAVVAAIKDDIKKVKADAAAALAAEALSKKIISTLTTGLQEMSIEADMAKVSHKVAFEEARSAKIVARQAKAASVTREYKLQAAYKEAEAAKASEAIALEEIKYLSGPRIQHVSQNESDAETVGKELCDSLRKRLEEAQEQAAQRLAEAMNSLKAEQDTEQELLKQLQGAMADMEVSKLTMQQALLQAETAEAGKVAVEGELRKWRAENRKRRAAADTASSVASPSPTYSGRLLTPETPEKSHHLPKTDHFAQVYQLSLPPPAQKVYSVNKNQIALKKMNMFARIMSFFSTKKRRAMA